MNLFLCLVFTIALAPAALWQTNVKKKETVERLLIANENRINEAIKKRDLGGFNNLVADDAVTVGSKGVVTAGELTKFLFDARFVLVAFSIEQPQVRMLDGDVALLTYKFTVVTSFDGKKTTGTTYASTIWAKRKSKWVAVFHQEADIPPPAN